MFGKKNSGVPAWTGQIPDLYRMNFSLSNIKPGLDNTHYDVFVSPDFSLATSKYVYHLVATHAHASEYLAISTSSTIDAERLEFRRLSHELLSKAVAVAKARNEIQVDFLAQAAMVKVLLREVYSQYDRAIKRCNSLIWEYEAASSKDMYDTIELKEKLSFMRKNKKQITGKVSKELFEVFTEVQRTEIVDLREATFGADKLLSVDFFSNPIATRGGSRVGDPSDDCFMIEEYVLLGHRGSDPNQYDALLRQIKSLFCLIEFPDLDEGTKQALAQACTLNEAGPGAGEAGPSEDNLLDMWIKQPAVMNDFFNVQESFDRYEKLAKKKGTEDVLLELQKTMDEQKALLEFFYGKFDAVGLIEVVIAAYEMRFVYNDYCPPLTPQQILQYFVKPDQRKEVESSLGRVVSKNPITLEALDKCLHGAENIDLENKHQYLARFLRDFSRYHRDFSEYNILKDVIARINLVADEKAIGLARANKVLYEFVLPHEEVFELEEADGGSHVILKADLRGTSGLATKLLEAQINPAIYFSENFFEPINEFIANFKAMKLSVEGDEIVLALIEQGADKVGYPVARACGLAIKLLMVQHQCNARSRKYQLPWLEMGIGISFQDAMPVEIVDGDQEIMVTPGIGIASRLADCTPSLRGYMRKEKKPFRVYIFQTGVAEDEDGFGVDDFRRYNVNGIGLNAVGFKRLSEEINLQNVTCTIPEFADEIFSLYTGKFPILSGKYQRLVIREAPIMKVSPVDLSVIEETGRKYYEVCTQPQLYEFVKNIG